MALLDSEVARIRYELGFHVLTVNAEPYISYVSLFDQIIQPYLSTGAATTSSTSVTAASTPTPVTLTLASATGFSSGCRVIIDVDDRQETVTAQSLSGVSLTVLLSKDHSGTYPCVVEGGESIIREILANIKAVRSSLSTSQGEGSVKKVDELEFYQNSEGSAFGSLESQLSFWRDELASALGICSMWQQKRAGAQRLAVY